MKASLAKHRIIVLSDAISIIAREAYAARKANKERGGSLVGIQSGNTSFVFYAIPTGPRADATWGRLETDAEFQNQNLAAIAAHYQPLNVSLLYLADYHVHQMGLDEFSSTDKNTFDLLLDDPSYSYLSGLPVILVSFHGNKPINLPFWISRQTRRVESATLEIVEPSDRRIAKLLKDNSYVPLETLMTSRTKEMPSNSVPSIGISTHWDALSVRLSSEIEEIRSIFSVPAQLRRTLMGYPCITATIQDHALYAVIPSEFPMNPATIFVRRPCGGSISEFHSKRSWNSISRIADIFEEAININSSGSTINIQA